MSNKTKSNLRLEKLKGVVVTWMSADIQSLRPDWTDAQCEEWLGANSKRIVERSVELGWEVIECLLDMED